MTTICAGTDLDSILERLEAAPSRFRQVVICCPFIDVSAAVRLVRFADAARRAGCGVRVITANRKGGPDWRHWPGIQQVGSRTLIAVPRLHAKVYLAIGRQYRDSWVVVTSANLTQAGLEKNVELGLLVRAMTPDGARTVDQVRWFLERLTM